MTIHDDIAKSVLGAGVSIASYIAQGIDTVPAWIREFGLPLVMLAGAIFAVVYLYKELRSERTARIIDRDAFLAKLEAKEAKDDTYRESILRATIEQTNEFKGLRKELEKR